MDLRGYSAIHPAVARELHKGNIVEPLAPEIVKDWNYRPSRVDCRGCDKEFEHPGDTDVADQVECPYCGYWTIAPGDAAAMVRVARNDFKPELIEKLWNGIAGDLVARRTWLEHIGTAPRSGPLHYGYFRRGFYYLPEDIQQSLVDSVIKKRYYSALHPGVSRELRKLSRVRVRGRQKSCYNCIEPAIGDIELVNTSYPTCGKQECNMFIADCGFSRLTFELSRGRGDRCYNCSHLAHYHFDLFHTSYDACSKECYMAICKMVMEDHFNDEDEESYAALHPVMRRRTLGLLITDERIADEWDLLSIEQSEDALVACCDGYVGNNYDAYWKDLNALVRRELIDGWMKGLWGSNKKYAALHPGVLKEMTSGNLRVLRVQYEKNRKVWDWAMTSYVQVYLLQGPNGWSVHVYYQRPDGRWHVCVEVDETTEAFARKKFAEVADPDELKHLSLETRK